MNARHAAILASVYNVAAQANIVPRPDTFATPANAVALWSDISADTAKLARCAYNMQPDSLYTVREVAEAFANNGSIN